MTIYSTFCNRLSFGVPLEDVFPRGDVHPSIKCLLLEIYTSFNQSTSKDLLQLLERDEMRIPSSLIEALMFHQPFTNAFCFQELIAALRYYLQSLPLPLMPCYTNNEDFMWQKLSLMCRASIEKRFIDKRLLFKVSNELLRLPKVNLLLIGYFLNFLRSLIQCKGRALNKTSADILANYFTPCVFTRRYVPRKAREFHHLMLYLILKWPEIQNHCLQTDPICFLPQSQLLRLLQTNETTNQGRLDAIREISEPVSSTTNISTSISGISLQESARKLMRNESTQTSRVLHQEKYQQTSISSMLWIRDVPTVQTNSNLLQFTPEAAKINNSTEEKLQKLPSCVNLNNFEFCDLENAATEPLNPEIKAQTKIFDLIKLKRGLELLKNLKQPELIRRAFSEDAFRRQIKYHKIMSTKKFFRTF